MIPEYNSTGSMTLFRRGVLGAATLFALCSLLLAVGAPSRSVLAELPGPLGRAALSIDDHVGGPQTPAPARSTRITGEINPSQFNVYASTIGGAIPAHLAGLAPRVYVPNSNAGTVDVIDPITMKVIDHFAVGAIPHHIAPSYDLTKLYVDNEGSSSLTVIDAMTGRVTGTVSVPFPYNLYFTPDGTKAIVVVERLSRIDFRDPVTWQLIKSVPIPWRGIDHLDFSADGSYLLGSTEWSGIIVKIDVNKMEITGSLNVGGLPIDVRLTPDGTKFYITNQGRHGVSVVDPVNMKEIAFISTQRGAHGLQVSRDTTKMYVTNRDAGSISVIDIAAEKVVATWPVGGSPDMIQLSPDGSQLWTSGRYVGTVEVIDTTTGKVLDVIRAGAGAHGLTYFPNTGLISLGHNGVYR